MGFILVGGRNWPLFDSLTMMTCNDTDVINDTVNGGDSLMIFGCPVVLFAG